MTANTDVNVAPAQTRDWINADGLRVKFPVSEVALGKGGEIAEQGGYRHVTEFDVDYTVMALGTDGTHAVILDYDVVFPAGGVIEKAEFIVTTAWDSSSSDVAINFGLIQRSDFTTIVDTDGIMNSVAKTVIDLAGNVVVTQAVGSYPDITTYEGSLLGAALAYDSVVCAYWENHVPTAGAGKLRLYWRDVL